MKYELFYIKKEDKNLIKALEKHAESAIAIRN